jgi:hypothetical protein
MTLPVTPEKASQVATDISAVGAQMLLQSRSWKTTVSSEHSAEFAVADMLPQMRKALFTFRDSTDGVVWSVAMKAKILAHATAQLANPPDDWWAEYDAARAGLVSVMSRAVSHAKGSAYTVNESGVITWGTLPASTLLASDLQTLINAFE